MVLNSRKYIFLWSRTLVSFSSMTPASLSMRTSTSTMYLPQKNTNLPNLEPFAQPSTRFATTYAGKTPRSVGFLPNHQPQEAILFQSGGPAFFQTSFNGPQPQVVVDAYQNLTLRTGIRQVSSSSAGPAKRNGTKVRYLHQER